MSVYFISDLHLDPSRPEITALFFSFLDNQACDAEALYILGDLFEVWIGDDERNRLALDVAQHLKRVAESGVDVFFVHGNRDFLIGERYARSAGMQLLPESRVIDLFGVPTLILHGDTLCTDDLAYQNYRNKVRNPRWQRRLSRLPLFVRRYIAHRLRRRSAIAMESKSAQIMDVNEKTARESAARVGAEQMIHGHTHRPGIYPLDIGHRRISRIVLGDWYQRGSVLECTPQGCQLLTLTFDPQ